MEGLIKSSIALLAGGEHGEPQHFRPLQMLGFVPHHQPMAMRLIHSDFFRPSLGENL
jgi:hypothetical protein